ncbi:hypothetical protein ADUPG1_013641 [Aduncisulcus paluster]|uniref:Uncharacterized protein n=1 Tax=Aduncisulcus paluster TaxID=2918883 RepID=A0ABQ5K6W2_9EUKA|nr:hypothetical protein ADUPG1_013641 [Aduncisulcus paluster]
MAKSIGDSYFEEDTSPQSIDIGPINHFDALLSHQEEHNEKLPGLNPICSTIHPPITRSHYAYDSSRAQLSESIEKEDEKSFTSFHQDQFDRILGHPPTCTDKQEYILEVSSGFQSPELRDDIEYKGPISNHKNITDDIQLEYSSEEKEEEEEEEEEEKPLHESQLKVVYQQRDGRAHPSIHVKTEHVPSSCKTTLISCGDVTNTCSIPPVHKPKEESSESFCKRSELGISIRHSTRPLQKTTKISHKYSHRDHSDHTDHGRHVSGSLSLQSRPGDDYGDLFFQLDRKGCSLARIEHGTSIHIGPKATKSTPKEFENDSFEYEYVYEYEHL